LASTSTKRFVYLATQQIPFDRIRDKENESLNYRVLNYGTAQEVMSNYLQVDPGDLVYCSLFSKLEWEQIEFFFPGPSPFPTAYGKTLRTDLGENAMLLREEVPQYIFPLMGSEQDSTITLARGGVRAFKARLTLVEDKSKPDPFENNILWLDPQIIVDGEIG